MYVRYRQKHAYMPWIFGNADKNSEKYDFSIKKKKKKYKNSTSIDDTK